MASRGGNLQFVRRIGVLAWLCWVFGLFWLWMLLIGSWNSHEALIGAVLAGVAGAIAEQARRAAGVSIRVDGERLRAGATAPLVVFADFGILTYALLRSLLTRDPVRGRYLARPADTGAKTTPGGAAYRAWTVLLAGYSPNAYVVDLSPDEDTVLVHDLIPWRPSEEPA
jgi:hypothetical protein